MILPLLVFIVVLIAVFISFKREHFNNHTTSSSNSNNSNDDSDSNSHNHTYIRFLIDNSSGYYDDDAENGNARTSLTNAIITNIIQIFNDEDLDGSLIDVSYTPIQEPNSSSSSSSETTAVSKDKSEVVVDIPKYFASIFLNQKINNLRSSFFGDVNNQITLSEDNILEMYEYDDGTYIHFESIEPESEPEITSAPEPTSTSITRKRITDEELLSKKSCINKEKNCNIGFKPYSILEFNGNNPTTDKPFTSEEKQLKINQMSERCSNEQDSEEKFCCDPNDYKLQGIYNELPSQLRKNFKNIVVDKCNNKINKIKVCEKGTDNCNPLEDIIRPATSYELCKLQNISDEDIDENGVVKKDKLVPDCYQGKCEHTHKLLEIDPGDQNQRITNHYYLIDAVKNNDLNYIKSYFSDKYNNVNESLEYGYPGNTILHQAVYDEMNEIVSYLITHNVDMAKVNKDGNSSLHIACFKGNYNAVHQLIKLGASVNCTNNMGDTPLHCAVRSGSYNTVLILINNGASAVLSHKNEHGESPLHTAVVSKKKNLKIIELLVENGADVHNINKYDKTVLGSLEEEPLTVTKESIRTYLQRIYYYKYDATEYNKILSNFPEVRPYEVDTSIPEDLEKHYNNYNPRIDYKELIQYDGDEDISDKNLYVKKHTKSMKANIPEEFFNDKNLAEDSNAIVGEDSFNTSGNKYNEEEEDNMGELTEENVTVEHFESSEEPTDNQENNLSILVKPHTYDKMLVYGSFGALSLLVIILIIIYLKKLK